MTLGEYLRGQGDDTQPSRPVGKPFLNLGAAAPASTPTWIGGGLSAGFNEMQGLTGYALEALGKASGSQGLEQYGSETATKNFAEAEQFGRPDLEIAPWKEGGASVVPWTVYQLSKLGPQIAGSLAAGAAIAVAAPEAATATGLAALGTRLPAFLGGGALRSGLAKAGADVAARELATKAAMETGKQFGNRFLGGLAVGYPLGVGSMYQEAQQDGTATAGDALAAFAMGIPYAALDAIQPAQLARWAEKGLSSGNILKRIATGVVEGAATEGPTEALQTAMEVSYRDDLSTKDKISQIVDAGATGAILGGVLGGGASGIKRLRTSLPSEVSTDDINAASDEELNPDPTVATPEVNKRVRRELTAKEKMAQMRQYVEGLTDAQRMARQMAGVPAAKKSRFADQFQGDADPVQIAAAAIRSFSSAEPHPAAEAVLRKLGVLEPVKGADGQITLAEVDFDAKIASKEQAVAAQQAKVAQSNGVGAKQLARMQSQLEELRTNKAIYDQAEQRIEAEDAGVPVPAPAAAAAPAPSGVVDQQPAVPAAAASAPSRVVGEDPVERAQARIAEQITRLDAIKAALPPEQQDAVERMVAVAPQPDQWAVRRGALSVLSGVQDDLLKPASKAETKAFKAAQAAAKALAPAPAPQNAAPSAPAPTTVVAPNAAPAAETVVAPPVPVKPKTAPAGPKPTSAAPKPAPKAAPAPAQPKAQVAQLTPYGVLQTALKAQDGQKVSKADVVRILKEQKVPVNEAIAAELMQRLEKDGHISPRDKTSKSNKRLVKSMANVQPETALVDQAPTEATKQSRLPGTVVNKTERSAAGDAETITVRGATLKNIPNVNVMERDTGTTKAERAVSAASAEIDKARQAALDGEIPVKADAATLRFVKTLASISETVRDRLETAFTKADNPFTNPDFDAVQSSKRLATAQVAARQAEKLAQERAETEAQVARDEKQAQKAQREKERPNTQMAEAMTDAVAEKVVQVRKGKPKPVEQKAAKASDYNSNQLTVAMEDAIDSNDVASVLDQIIAETTNPVYEKFARLMKRIGVGQRVTMKLARGASRKDVYAVAALDPDGSTEITYYDDGSLTNEHVLHELIHAFVQQRWGKLNLYSAQNKAALGDTVERNDAVVAEFNRIALKVKSVIETGIKEGYLKPKDAWVSQVRGSTDEMLTYAVTNERFRAYMSRVDEYGNFITTKPKPTLMQRIWRAILSMIGVKKQDQTPEIVSMFEMALSASERLVEAGEGVGPSTIGSQIVYAMSGQRYQPAIKEANATVTKLSTRATKVGEIAERTMTNMAPSLRQKVLYFASMGGLARVYDKLFKGQIKRLIDAHQLRVAMVQKMSQMSLMPWERYQKLPQASKDTVRKLMEYTYHQIDPRKTWDQQPDLHTMEKADELRVLAEQAHAMLEKAKTSDKAAARIYFDNLSVNEGSRYAQHVMSLWTLLYNTPAAKLVPYMQQRVDPMEQFTYLSNLHDSPDKFRKHWKQESDRFIAQVEKALKDHKSTVKQGGKVDRAVVRDMGRLAKELAKTKREQKAMLERPYFHLGRFGDYFVSFDLAPTITEDADGNEVYEFDKAAAKRVQDAMLEAGFTDPTFVLEGTDQRKTYIRLDNEADYLNMVKLFEKLRKEGVVGERVLHGRRDVGKMEQLQATDNVIQTLIRNIGAAPIGEDLPAEERAAEEEYRQRAISEVRTMYLNLMPDISSIKVAQRRENVQGFTEDMMRAFAYRTQVAGHALANLSAMNKTSDVFRTMREDLREAQETAIPGQEKKSVRMLEVMQELLRRESLRATEVGFGFIDRLKAYNHAYFLGMSPAYVMSQLTQPMVLLWPEIAKKQGYAKAAKTVAKVTPLAMKVLKATLASAKEAGWRNFPDHMVTEEALRKAKIPNEDIDFIMRAVNSGILDLSSAAREHGRVVEGRTNKTEDLALRYAASAGFYSEVFTRTIAALSAREAAGSNMTLAERDDYVASVVNASMLNYSNWYISRATGKSGMLGPLTPLALSFMQYTSQVVEKLFLEVNTAFLDSTATEQERLEARRFMYAHMTSMVVLAGSLGLPMASVLALAVEKTVNALGDDDEPYDAKAAWRNYLASVFGKDIGEILARGLPRALNVDLSGRVGEADILPFTKLLTDKREWKDAIKEWAFRTAGAPTSMLTNIVSGGSKMMQGDALGAMREALPTALRGPLEAGRMASDGTYIDKYGNEMPMTVKSADILVQALGFSPANRAEMNEAAQSQRGRDMVLRRRATNLRTKLATAIEKGDQTAARDLMAEARKFDSDNPSYSVLRSMASTLRRRAQDRAKARATGLPLGVSIKDLDARRLTDFANY